MRVHIILINHGYNLINVPIFLAYLEGWAHRAPEKHRPWNRPTVLLKTAAGDVTATEH